MKQADPISRPEMVEIVERASSVEERLNGDFVPVGGDETVVDERLQAWCQALGNGDWDRFERRLTWDGLDLDAVRPALGPVRLRDAASLPAWAELVAEALRQTVPERQDEVDEPWPSGFGFLDPEAPVAFEEILALFVLAARERLAERAPAYGELLSDRARSNLERALLRRLLPATDQVLLSRFEAVRAQEQTSWDRLFALAQDPEGRSLYQRFIRRLADGGLAALLREYPVLARHLGRTSTLWIDTNAEFLGRLQADLPELEHRFGDGEELGNLAEIQTSLSDPHRGGRSVNSLTFASGRKVVYKPKDMGTEANYHRLLAWLNERGAPLSFKVLEVLDRSTHGWVEFVEHLPCENREEARRYYERAGMLLCLFYALEGTDCHYENIIASGEYPVLIDTETLMHHRASYLASEEDARMEALELLNHSVLRTGLLPRWELSSDGRTAFHMSGLGEPSEQELPMRVPEWVRVNTDRMTMETVPVRLPERENVPELDGAPLSLNEHSPQVVQGFRRMYRFLLEWRDELVDSEPLRALAREQVRFVFRATRIYGVILRNLRDRRYLRDGADLSVQLEQLGRAQVPPRAAVDDPDDRPLMWPVFAAERRAIEAGDVPFFTARASSDALIISPEEEIEACFQEPSAELVLGIIRALDEDDLEKQVAFVEGSLYAHLARGTAASQPEDAAEPEDEVPSGPPSDQAFVAAALSIAETIRSRAIRASDGTAAWIAPQYLVQAERYQLQSMDFDLYGGTSGVALFLAAAERISPGSGYGELALAAVRPLQTMLNRRPDLLAEVPVIGAASGLVSIAYSLGVTSHLLDEPALLEEARRVALLVSEERIASDRVLDVIGGAAGAILGLSALYEALHDEEILERMVACGEHLLETRTENESGHRAWVTDEAPRFSGISHGTAGIVYALLRLHEYTGDARLIEAAEEAVAYEDTLYSPEHHNWLDNVEPDRPAYLWQWCRGAPGIGLARLAGRGVLDTKQVREDFELALQTTLEYGAQGVDHICCGGMGRAEVLFWAGRRLARPELVEAARAMARRVVTRAERTGGYNLHPMLPRQVDNPGLFQGTAGIGYELLRMAHPDLLPSVLLWE